MGGFLDKLEVHLPPTSGRPRASPLRVRCVLPLTFFPSGEGWIATALVARRGGLCEAHGGRSFLMALPPTATPPPPSRGRLGCGAWCRCFVGARIARSRHSLRSCHPLPKKGQRSRAHRTQALFWGEGGLRLPLSQDGCFACIVRTDDRGRSSLRVRWVSFGGTPRASSPTWGSAVPFDGRAWKPVPTGAVGNYRVFAV